MKTPNKIGIYRIINLINKKIYVGSSTNILNRWSGHKMKLRKNCHANSYLQNTWNKYGAEAFKFEILEECSKELLGQREQYFVNLYQSDKRKFGYNLRIVVDSNRGHIVSEKQRKFMSDFMKAIPRTEEWRRNIGAAHKGRKLSKEHIEILRIAREKRILEKGPTHLDSWKRKVSEEQLVKLYLQGNTMVAVAKMYHMGPMVVSRVLKSHGVQFRPHVQMFGKANPMFGKPGASTGSWRNRLSEEQIINLYNSGQSISSLQDQYHVSDYIISRVLKQNGIAIRLRNWKNIKNVRTIL